MNGANFPELRNDLILRAAKGAPTDRVPVWVMRQAGRYLPEFLKTRETADFFTMCRTPELACEVTLQPIKRFPLLDAAIIFSDILVVPQALGMEVQMQAAKGPHFPNPLKTPSDVKKLTKNVDVKKELGYVFEAITLTRHKLEGKVPLFGFAGGPWTLMAYMIEGGGSKTFSKAKTWLFAHKKESKELLQLLTDVTVQYLIGQVEAGAQILQVFESWAGELSKEAFDEFSFPYLAEIATKVKEGAKALGVDIPMIVFAKGAHYALEELADTEYDVVGLDWTIEPREARLQTDNKVSLQGNLDPCVLYAPPEEIKTHVRKMITEFGTQKLIANLGHGMHPDHDPQHLLAFLEAVITNQQNEN